MEQRASPIKRRVYFPNGVVIDRSPHFFKRLSGDLVYKTVPWRKTLFEKPKAFANPNSFGYGGGETPWPFDRKRAYTDARYRAGIRNALNASWTASNWKAAARPALVLILDDLLAAEEIFQ